MNNAIKYIFTKDIQSILDVFTSLFDIRIAFFSTSGDEVKVGNNKPLCQFCSLLRDTLGYTQTCLDLDHEMRLKAYKEKKMISYTCHGSMQEVVKPLYLDGDFIGYFMIGQFRLSGKSLNPNISKQWADQCGTDELERAYASTPEYPEQYVKNILKLFTFLVDHILFHHMVELRGHKSIKPLITYLQTHLEAHLDLDEASELSHQSPSTLSHKFKKLTGTSFKQFQILTKLDKADEFFEKYPDMTVKEAAFRVGYHDPYYFSRLYKKHRGCSPSTTRKKHREKLSDIA